MSVPVSSPPLDLITTSLLDLFDASGRMRAGGQGFDAVYDGDPVNPVYPYWILFPLPGGSADPMPDLDKRSNEVTAVWQVSAVSKLRNQAQQLQRVLHDLLLTRGPDGAWLYPIAIPVGWSITDRTADAVPAGVIRTGDTPNAIFTAPFKFSLTITPA